MENVWQVFSRPPLQGFKFLKVPFLHQAIGVWDTQVFFLVDVCHAGFKIFLENGGLGNENLKKFGSRELEFWAKHG